MAECHPVGFRWVMEAKRRGATIIHVDPRFTRTSAVADIHVPIRPGSDIAFLGGLVNYIISNERWFRDYVVNYTNAAALVSEDYRDTEDLDGLFSGWDAEKGQYDPSSWQYRGVEVTPAAGHREMFSGEPRAERGAIVSAEQHDFTLTDPLCVFQIVKRHFSRYTPEVVQEACGVPPELFEKVARALCDNSGRDRTSAFCYAVGWTQHSVGVQYIRTAAIVQMLLGNIGRPGGGIMALRGHSSIQGSTDIPTLYNMLPGYLPMPKASYDTDLKKYLEYNESASGWWSEFPKYTVSLLKAWYGPAATSQNDWCYHYLPHISGDHSHMVTVAAMADAQVQGYFVMGENPAVGSMNCALQRKGLHNLKWLVVRDFAPTETAEFWRNAPEIVAGDVKPEQIGTEVFFFPCAAHTEKDGTFTNTQRLLQWHHKAVEPPGDCRSELHFIWHLGRRLKELYRSSSEQKDFPLRDLTWDYRSIGEIEEPDAEEVLAEISGYTLGDHKYLPGYKELKDDGSTVCGCWIYCGCYKDGVNQPARRKPASEQTWVAPEWGWAWPANRRLLYNRASADPDGKPWSERKKYVWWDPGERKWTGYDNPDFIVDRPPDYRPGPGAKGIDTLSGIDPFIMQAEGKAWMYDPNGLLDGPLPTHYEPEESVLKNPLYGQQCNPARMEWIRNDNPYHKAWGDPDYPFIATTYRLTEHHTAGGMSRWLPWLCELQPEMFIEVSPELAELRGLENGGWATVSTIRGEIEARVLVTGRMQPFVQQGRTLHTVGIPYHWSWIGRSTGDAANELTAFVADPNVSIEESKAFSVQVVAGRRAKKRRAAAQGPLVEREVSGPERDLAPVHEKPGGKHGLHAGKTEMTEES
ncbi:formate dehydrogenase subunit alpha [Geomonas paludis]|nr:formate dehydrogenase subunit alpha [Geomonas paludis]